MPRAALSIPTLESSVESDDRREDPPALLVQAIAVVERAQEAGIVIRLIGGIAVALHSPSARHRALRRDYADIDFVAGAVDRQGLDGLLADIGYFPDKRFNSLHGKTRRLYFDEGGFQQRGHRDGGHMMLNSWAGGSSQMMELRFVSADTTRLALPPLSP
jgi:hypothetical protein